jgi:hypothetical protein
MIISSWLGSQRSIEKGQAFQGTNTVLASILSLGSQSLG